MVLSESLTQTASMREGEYPVVYSVASKYRIEIL